MYSSLNPLPFIPFKSEKPLKGTDPQFIQIKKAVHLHRFI